ncbi:hypothetical protein VTJ04DRAFT_1898 [Mycothermus thermophilus]|uniref:uncharacterized protein n=1 Tax=Humicola insolens TaxID=85995 RepID=UPI0037441D92
MARDTKRHRTSHKPHSHRGNEVKLSFNSLTRSVGSNTCVAASVVSIQCMKPGSEVRGRLRGAGTLSTNKSSNHPTLPPDLWARV